MKDSPNKVAQIECLSEKRHIRWNTSKSLVYKKKKYTMNQRQLIVF